jgi:hypothetical protein
MRDGILILRRAFASSNTRWLITITVCRASHKGRAEIWPVLAHQNFWIYGPISSRENAFQGPGLRFLSARIWRRLRVSTLRIVAGDSIR